MKDFQIVNVDQQNVRSYGIFCVKNMKHPGYIAKSSWLKKRFEEGLRLKLILTKDGKQAGFLEYIPGEYTWRVINAPDYFVIHCIWVYSNKFPNSHFASILLESCIQDAQKNGKAGVAVVTSDGPWMANKRIFKKNGFKEADHTELHFQLLVKQITDGPMPSFPKNWPERLRRFDGLQLVYTNQCPYIGKALADLPPVAKKFGVELNLTELNNPVEAREKMPSPYGVICLVYNGRLLADHPISATRFGNILRKEIN
jgi:N-acetylglutamate synthase-like GNAT family acetyltransferase